MHTVQRTLDRFILSRTLANAHSAEDGTSGIARGCCETGVAAGSFLGPEGTGLPGPAVLLPEERHTVDEELLWTTSLASLGIDDFFS